MVLIKMGFGRKWVGWMLECVSTAIVVMLLNGSTTNEFIFGRGLRQKDTLSPFLFILVTEMLHLMLVKAKEMELIKGVKEVILGSSLLHLQFADDTIVFLVWIRKW